MTERLTNEPAKIEKGCLVKFRQEDKDVFESVLSESATPGGAYRVLGINYDNNYVFCGPADMDPKDMDDFDLRSDFSSDERYVRVFAVHADVLRRVLHS